MAEDILLPLYPSENVITAHRLVFLLCFGCSYAILLRRCPSVCLLCLRPHSSLTLPPCSTENVAPSPGFVVYVTLLSFYAQDVAPLIHHSGFVWGFTTPLGLHSWTLLHIHVPPWTLCHALPMQRYYNKLSKITAIFHRVSPFSEAQKKLDKEI